MTLEVTARVLALRAWRAGSVRAIVYQLAGARGLSRVSGLARANLNHIRVTTQGKSLRYAYSKETTHLHVLLRCANGVRAARIVREARNSASVQIADLLLRTVVVDLAFDRLTADLVVSCIAEEA